MNHCPSQYPRRRTWGQKAPALAIALFLVIILNTLAGCGAEPTAPAVSIASPTVSRPTLGLSPSPSPSSSPTPTVLPTVSTAAPSDSGEETAAATATPTSTSSATPTRTATPTLTLSPSPTFTPPVTATWTSTPLPPGPTITPTQTITPTPTPTLTPTPLFTPTPLPPAPFSGDVVHFLLIGLDSTRNLRDQNTDVMIVAAVNKDTKQVSLLSIPRDLWVYIPTYGWSRINMAHKFGYRTGLPAGGPRLLIRTIEQNFGIPIDHWVRVDFQGFARVVDGLGGVEMTVACPINLRYMPPTSEEQEEMPLEPGVHHMDGATALRYVRTRRNSSDFDRARRQQQFLKAMWIQTKNPEILLKIPELWSALKDSFQTDLNLGDALSLAPVALEISPQRVRSRYIGTNHVTGWTNANGWQVLLPDYEKIQQVVASLYAPPSAREDQVASEAARIQVRNGTHRHQLAKIAADELRWQGLNIVDTGLADHPNYKKTQIIVFNDKPKALEILTQQLGVKPENVIQQFDPNQPADLLVILGEDYDPCR